MGAHVREMARLVASSRHGAAGNRRFSSHVGLRATGGAYHAHSRADTAQLVQAAAMGMREIYQEGFQLIKAGVMLLDLVPDSIHQGELALGTGTSEIVETTVERDRLMSALDGLNDRYGKGTVHLGSTGATERYRVWGMRQERRTPQYTTQWAEVPVAKGLTGAGLRCRQYPGIHLQRHNDALNV